MELPRRQRGDELLPPGEMTRVRASLRNVAARHDLKTVIACAFDHSTRMLPFLYADMKMAPAGVRAIGSALVDSGFNKTRIVLQQWNPNFRPSQMRIEGELPDLFLVSSMAMHAAECEKLVRDACRIEPARRPLIIVGGPRVIYEPWTVFSADPDDPWGADAAVTGEEYVLLSLLETLLDLRAGNEPLRSVFHRARKSGALDGIQGLVFPQTDSRGVPQALIDTGIQRLLGDLDELPHASLGYGLLEMPSRGATLARAAIPSDRVHKYSEIASLVMTQGCRFACSYCPIPAYNQRKMRGKSGERIADEMEHLFHRYNLRLFFGTDDNFLADRDRTLEIAEALARRVDAASRPHCKIRWGTEATIHDTLKMREHLPLIRRAGLWALWLGVEDMTGTLVKKGQAGGRTIEAFGLLRQNGIYPVPMLMHSDAQPLVTWRSQHGLLNQLSTLRKAGALYMQVLMLTPSPGSKSYRDMYTSGVAFESVAGRPVEPSMTGGMYVIASGHPRPWIKQLNLFAAYAWFFNPLRMLLALVRSKSRIPLSDAETWPPVVSGKTSPPYPLGRRLPRTIAAHLADAAIQIFGMWGTMMTLRRTLGWAARLVRGPIVRQPTAPASQLPLRAPTGAVAAHSLAADLPIVSAAPSCDEREKAA